MLEAPHPFLRWAGGKRQLLSTILPLVPAKFGRYHEPFVGGGAVFFGLHTARGNSFPATLSDSNENLIATYRSIERDAPRVIQELAIYEKFFRERGKSYYYAVRARRRGGIAAWFIFLNKTCFNGLYRVNSAGGFNVPIGKFKTPPLICDEINLLNCSRALHGVQLVSGDFVPRSGEPKRGDFVYLDPPYAPVNEASFTKYTAKDFGKEDQERLAVYYGWLSKWGVKALLSNSDTPFVRKLYSSFEIIPVKAKRSINSIASKRGAVGEVLVKNY